MERGAPDPPRELPGLQWLHYLIDRDNGNALVISLWDTEENLRRLEAKNASLRTRLKAEARPEFQRPELRSPSDLRDRGHGRARL